MNLHPHGHQWDLFLLRHDGNPYNCLLASFLAVLLPQPCTSFHLCFSVAWSQQSSQSHSVKRLSQIIPIKIIQWFFITLINKSQILYNHLQDMTPHYLQTLQYIPLLLLCPLLRPSRPPRSVLPAQTEHKPACRLCPDAPSAVTNAHTQISTLLLLPFISTRSTRTNPLKVRSALPRPSPFTRLMPPKHFPSSTT